MKTVSVSGALREHVGKKDARILREKGMIPCVVYGVGEPRNFYADEKMVSPLFSSPEVCFVELDLGGEKLLTIVQEAQFHKVTGSLLHIDFFILSDKRPITMAVPLRIEGSAPGVLKGGKLYKGMRKLRVRTLPKQMPEEIKVDISKMDIADEVKVRDLASDQYELLEAPNTTVVMVKTTRNVVEEKKTEEAKA